jgi:hypothetical protein
VYSAFFKRDGGPGIATSPDSVEMQADTSENVQPQQVTTETAESARQRAKDSIQRVIDSVIRAERKAKEVKPKVDTVENLEPDTTVKPDPE